MRLATTPLKPNSSSAGVALTSDGARVFSVGRFFAGETVTLCLTAE